MNDWYEWRPELLWNNIFEPAHGYKTLPWHFKINLEFVNISAVSRYKNKIPSFITWCDNVTFSRETEHKNKAQKRSPNRKNTETWRCSNWVGFAIHATQTPLVPNTLIFDYRNVR